MTHLPSAFSQKSPALPRDPSNASPAPITVGAVLFDLDAVLYDESAWRHWFVQLLRRFDLRANSTSLFHAFSVDYLREEVDCEDSYWRAMRRFLLAVGLTSSQSDEAIAAGRSKRRQFRQDSRPFPGVAETLGNLSASLVPLGVVCSRSTPAQVVRCRLKQLGIADWLRAVETIPMAATSSNLRAVYEQTCHTLGTSLSRVAYVSANPWALLATQGLGMKTIAFNTPASLQVDVHVTHFAQLAQVLTCERSRLLAA